MDQLLKRVHDEYAALTHTLPFSEYLEGISQRPERALLAHARVHRAIAGADTGADAPPGAPGPGLPAAFTAQCFGMGAVVAQVVDYFASAARRLDTRRRILLLVGPPGSGKSTLMAAIKQALERFARTEDGAAYTIQGCPLHEDPLHLIPPHHRDELPVYVEGDLCPYCRWLVREVHRGDLALVPVERFTFSAAAGSGIGTFIATDPGSADLTRLVGRVEPVPDDADPRRAQRVFRLDGAIEQGNRGLVDLVDAFKMDERFLDVLLMASQEHGVQTAGSGVVYVDAALVAESNLAEYEALVADRKTAALQDRLVVVRVPYVLEVEEEVRIYRRMLADADLAGRHVSPLALRLAATLAVLTRLGSPGRADGNLLKRLRVYAREVAAEWDPESVDRLRAEQPDEGFFGLSPRYVMTQLSNALASGAPCVTAGLAMDQLWRGLVQRTDFRPEQAGRWSTIFQLAGAELDDMVRLSFEQAMVPDFHQQVQRLAERLRAQLEAGSAEAGDGFSVEAVERALHLPSYQREAFRGTLLAELRQAGDLDQPAAYRRHPGLRGAVDRLLVPGWQAATAVLNGGGPGEQQLQHRSVHDVRARLISEHGYCEVCAEEVTSQAALLTRPRAARQRRPSWAWRRA